VSRQWFLLLILVGLPMALAFPAHVGPLVDWLPVRGVVAAALFLMAWGLESRRLWQALLHPGAAVWSLVIGYGVLPVLAWLASLLLPLPDLAVGMLICASGPCTLASAILWTRLGGGNEATALLAVLLSTSLGSVATSLWVTITLPVAGGATPPMGEMMADLSLVLIVPVALGQLARLVPLLAWMVTRHRQTVGILSRLLIFAMMLQAAADLGKRGGGLDAWALVLTAGLCLGVHLAALFLGLYSARLLGFAHGDCVAVAFAGSQKTLPVGLYLFRGYFEATYPLAVLPLVFYHVGQLVIDTFVADYLVRSSGESGDHHEDTCRGLGPAE